MTDFQTNEPTRLPSDPGPWTAASYGCIVSLIAALSVGVVLYFTLTTSSPTQSPQVTIQSTVVPTQEVVQPQATNMGEVATELVGKVITIPGEIEVPGGMTILIIMLVFCGTMIVVDVIRPLIFNENPEFLTLLHEVFYLDKVAFKVQIALWMWFTKTLPYGIVFTWAFFAAFETFTLQFEFALPIAMAVTIALTIAKNSLNKLKVQIQKIPPEEIEKDLGLSDVAERWGWRHLLPERFWTWFR